MRYPEALRRRGIMGGAIAQFVVDSTGRARLDTWRVIHSTHPGFDSAVRDRMPLRRWRSATNAGAAACELVREQVVFELHGRTAYVVVGP